MENRVLEINLMSAKDLNKVNLITKMDVYAVVQISGGEKSKQKVKTPVDKDGDSNPTWNFPVKFTVDEAAVQQNRLTLVFKFKCERALGDKDIGEVHVPIKELLQSGDALEGKQQFVSYQVRKPSGKPKGQLNFGYKFGEKVAAKADNHHHHHHHHEEPMMAYPATANHMVGPSSVYPPPPPQHAVVESGPYPLPAEGKYYNHSHPPPAPAHAAPPAGYPYPPPPQPAGYGYPPPPPYGGYPPPPAPGYGYPPQPGYGYPPVQQPPKKNSKLGLGLGAGLLGGALGGMLIGDMVSDAAAYDAGYDAGFADAGFDF